MTAPNTQLDPSIVVSAAPGTLQTGLQSVVSTLVTQVNTHATQLDTINNGSGLTQPYTDVRTIGVVMNDNTKRAANTAAWKTYIAAQQAAGNPIRVEIPAGTMYLGRDGTGLGCVIFTGITVGIDIRGQGRYATTVDWGGTGNSSGWSCFRLASGTTNFTFRDMTVTQSTITNPDAGQQHHCFHLVATSGAEVTDGEILNVTTRPLIGSGFLTLGGNDGVNDFLVRRVWVNNYRCYGSSLARSGIELQRGYTDVRMSNFYIENCKDGEVNLEPTGVGEMSHAVLENGLVVHDPTASGFSAMAWNGNSASTTYNSRSRVSNVRVIDGQVQFLTTEFVDVDNLSIELINANTASQGNPALQIYQNNKDMFLRNTRIKRLAAVGDGDLVYVLGETGGYYPERVTFDGGDFLQYSAGNIFSFESSDKIVLRNCRLQMLAASPSALDFVKIRTVLTNISNILIQNLHCSSSAKARAVVELSAGAANLSITGINITGIEAGQASLATTGILMDVPSANGATMDSTPVLAPNNLSGCDNPWTATNQATGKVFPILAGNRGDVCVLTGTVTPGGVVSAAYGSQYIWKNGASSALFFNLSNGTTWTQVTIP